MINSKTPLSFFLVCLFLFALSSAAATDEPTLRAQICIIKADGTTEIRHMVLDQTTGKMVLLERDATAAPAAAPPLKIEQSLRWEGVDTVEWTLNKDANIYRGNFDELFRNVVNKWRGSKNMPKMALADGTVSTPDDLFDQTVLIDGKNGIYITEDNRLINSFAPPWIRVDGLMLTWFYSGSAPEEQQVIIDGKVFNPYTIVETDGFFRADLFAAFSSGVNQGNIRVSPEYLTAHEFGHAFGYKHSTNPLDYMCYFVPTVTLKDLRRGKRSPVWDISRTRDMQYYDHYSDPDPKEAIILPRDGDTVALEDVVGFSEPVFLTTNLKGYSSSRPLKLVFSRLIQKKRRLKEKKIFSTDLVSGQYSFQGRTGEEFRTYRISLISAENIAEFGPYLLGELAKYGKPGTIDGVDYALVLPVRITVVGYLSDDNKAKATISSDVIFVRQIPPTAP